MPWHILKGLKYILEHLSTTWHTSSIFHFNEWYHLRGSSTMNFWRFFIFLIYEYLEKNSRFQHLFSSTWQKFYSKSTKISKFGFFEDIWKKSDTLKKIPRFWYLSSSTCQNSTGKIAEVNYFSSFPNPYPSLIHSASCGLNRGKYFETTKFLLFLLISP